MFLKRTVLAASIGTLLFAAPLAVNAAGMGKVTVLSALGQPLRAELDVVASREEMASLTARVAPFDAFRQANVEYAPVLSGVRFVLDKRPDGKPYFRIQTDRVVNDPFIDLLVELNWSSGRLVREYAFLLDPPELKVDTAPVPTVNAPAGQSQENTPPIPETAATDQNALVTAKEVPPQPVPAKSPMVSGSPASTTENAANTVKVKSGDTLSKIAARSAPEGVTLDQMLVALFNNNRDAFDGGNMNRLRAGKILSIPDVAAATSVGNSEARKVVVAQSADFNAYRNSLAASAAKQTPVAEQAQQSSGGKITPKVEEKTPLAAGQDKLQVSRSEGDAKTGKGSKASEEDMIARDKALKEANTRIAELEKNLTDLKKLAEMKGQAATEAAKGSPESSAKPATAGTGATAMPSAPVSAAVEAPAVSATVAAPAADEQPKPKPRKKIAPPPPPPEPSFLEDNALLVYGGGGALAAILGFLGFRTWKRKRDAEHGQGITVSDLAASSVFGAAASANIDTANEPQTNFGNSTMDAAEHQEGAVDPIQEAEVYMAYGRDGQAEEILRDALQKDQGNLAVYLKLLEIYAGRKSVQQFNEVAADLNTRAGGTGPEWSKAVDLGRSLDPSNPMYGGSRASAPAHEETVAVPSSPVAEKAATTMIMQAPPVQEAPPEKIASAADEAPSALDFDLDLGSSVEAAPAPAEAAPADIDFDLDLGGDSAKNSGAETDVHPAAAEVDIDLNTSAEAGNSIDFDIGAATREPQPADVSASSGADPVLDFNFDLGNGAPALDLSSINLDLGEPAAQAGASASSEVATKLELAHAYEEMGDKEGARELLQEVLAEGNPAQQEAARSKLAQLN